MKQRRALVILADAGQNGVNAGHILDKADFEAWLGGNGGTELLRSAADDKLRLWSVSRRVNKTGTDDDDPMLIDEVAP